MNSNRPDIVFNPSTAHNEHGPLARWNGFANACAEGGGLWWTGKKTAKAGDIYLFWFGAPKMFIGGIGVHDGTVEGKTRWPSPQIGFDPIHRLRTPIGIEELRNDPVLKAWWAGNPFWGGPKTVMKQPVIARRLLELIMENNSALAKLLTPYVEGLVEAKPVSSLRAKRWASSLSRLSAEDQERIYRAVMRAERDRDLRPRVLALWGNACAACGVKLSTHEGGVWECEVAHVREVNAKGMDDIDNAFPVCRTHHWAFDRRLWTIHPKNMSVVVSAHHRKSSVLAKLHGEPVVSDGPGGPSMLNRAYLQERLDALGT